MAACTAGKSRQIASFVGKLFVLRDLVIAAALMS